MIGCDTLPELKKAEQIIMDTLVIATDKRFNAVIWE